MDEPPTGGVSPCISSSSPTVIDATCAGINGSSSPGLAAGVSATSIYQVNIAGFHRCVTVAWCKTLISHIVTVSIDATVACKVDLKPWPFWGKKGLKSIEVDGKRVDIFWDLRSAKLSNGSPAPVSGYYIALVCDDEVVLLVGDGKKDAYKRTKSRPSLEDPKLVCKRENVVGKKCFSARTKFDERKKEHDIVIESSVSSTVAGGVKDGAEMWISIDGVVVVHVDNLRWKFRGNDTVLIDEVPVQVFWDVHDWLFAGASGSGGSHALFIFKLGSPIPPVDDHERPRQQGKNAYSQDFPEYLSAAKHQACNGLVALDFCFFLYAWKME